MTSVIFRRGPRCYSAGMTQNIWTRISYLLVCLCVASALLLTAAADTEPKLGYAPVHPLHYSSLNP